MNNINTQNNEESVDLGTNDKIDTSSAKSEKNNPTSSESGEANESSEDKYKDGEELSFVRVRFPGNSKSQPFLLGKRKFTYGQKVLAMSDRGMTVGYINSFPYTVKYDKSMGQIRTIAKVATEEDIKEQKSYMQKEKEAEVLCLRLIEKHNLDMNVTHVEFIQFGKKAVFYFNAPERVDFRNLVKDLVGDLKMRIELRQISVRDRAAAIGAIGACGLQTCCSSFLSNYGNVTIKMAKNQNLALIPSKINGVCGQVKCCIKYEDDVYTEKRKNLPIEQTFIKVKNGDIGKVTKLHLMNEQFDMITDKGQIRRYFRTQFEENNSLPPKGWSFPDQFRSIVQETSTVIGLSDLEEEKLSRYDAETDESEESSAELIIEDDSDIIDTNVVIQKNKLDSEEGESRPTKKPFHQNNGQKHFNKNNNQNRNNQNRNQQNAGPKEQGNNNKQTAPQKDGAPKKPFHNKNKRPFGQKKSE